MTLLAYRELDHKWCVTSAADPLLVDPHYRLSKRPSFLGLLPQSHYPRFAGYEDIIDAKRRRIEQVFGRLMGVPPYNKDAAVVAALLRDFGAVTTVRAGLKSREHLAATGVLPSGEARVAGASREPWRSKTPPPETRPPDSLFLASLCRLRFPRE